jgi:protein subunit release factor B
MTEVPLSDEALLDECDVDTFRSSGPGGQNVNRRDTAVRLRHRPTGITIVCQQERSQHRNKELALALLRRKIQLSRRVRARRVPSKMPRRVRAKILASKKHNAAKKKLRRRPGLDD